MAEPNPSPAPRVPVRRAVVTGASSGIGKAFSERLAADQYEVCLVARRRDRLETLADGLRERSGVPVNVRPTDLTNPSDLDSLCRELADSPPDLLVNNAGFGTAGPFASLDAENEVREIQLNVVALVRLTRSVLPAMVERGHGDVINVSSLAGLSPAPFTATYAATKAFVTHFTEAIHEEVRGSGVRIQALLPGFTRTEFQQVAGVDPSAVPSAAWMTPEAVVEASLAGLERGEALVVPGAGNRALAVVQRLAPRGLTRRLIARVSRTRLGAGD
jgi:hypothetical protein